MTTPVCTSASKAAAPVTRTLSTSARSTSALSTSARSTPVRSTSTRPALSGLTNLTNLSYPSFSAYVKARQPVLLRTARSLTANPCDAEDLLQTALAKTYVAWERIEDHRALDGYVRRALLNTRTSQWRKRKVDEFACDELPEPDGVQAADPAEQQVLHDAMWRAIMKLPARQRAMVVLRYYEDLSEVQTAEVLGVSVGTVKSAVSRALGKLREDPELEPVR
ncbi:SigE family RNA polymerase sigma factor [Streptomyces europaeiscabiei]|uniref:SigE family RNA polymerase sigma factor n=1 Tax=Streptomyces europaeiscabiei TaxID=146819 RepID=A0ABU4NIW9_9ACTN|nr:SigE family RNA polymerase sigma factor [Streptomyces europaeiscabiei]MDX2764815.1 SigE family RNA polymerase sigma factor [Streptomyces europaeiscabiei]MDX3544848.1 SigE family RNA polymerase sigma factor [Streptomyces europaeiscabiei]MDX3554536.1 SigE family RNA polymerase sigma factor [Streptomyces europaeiscabiei]MDX3702562.1 SigE family RNA polymerase sigma factor [Streptomyces europaeiscabiei]